MQKNFGAEILARQMGFSSTLDTYLGPVFGRQQRHKVVVVRGQSAVQLRSLAGPSPSTVGRIGGTIAAARRRRGGGKGIPNLALLPCRRVHGRGGRSPPPLRRGDGRRSQQFLLEEGAAPLQPSGALVAGLLLAHVQNSAAVVGSARWRLGGTAAAAGGGGNRFESERRAVEGRPCLDARRAGETGRRGRQGEGRRRD